MAVMGEASDAHITALAEAAIAANAPDFWETFDSQIVLAGAAVSANSLYLMRLPEISATTTTITHYVAGTAAGNAISSLWSFDGTTFTQEAASASTAIAGTNTTQDVSLTTPFAREPGIQMYAGFITDSATATIGRVVATAPGNSKGVKVRNISIGSLALPATIALASTSAAAVTIWLHGA